jgi:glycosyltransferase involved in cell wall biosynthesis
MDRKTTILFITRWGGTIGPNVWLGQVVDQCLRQGIGVHIASPWRDDFLDSLAARGAVIDVVDGIEWIPRSLNPLRHIRRVLATRHTAKILTNVARRSQADVICINGMNTLLLPRVGKLSHRPVCAVMHGARLLGSGILNHLFFAFQQHWVDRYLVLVSACRDLLVGAGVDASKIMVIPNGVDTDRFQPGPRDVLLASQFGISEDQFCIGTVTHLTPRKGVHHLIAAMGLIAAKLPNVRCIVVGDIVVPSYDGPYAAQVREEIQRLGLKDKVILAGRRTDVPQLLNVFDLVVHPSETEACPYSVLEAQSCGKAVVGFRVGGMTDVVQDGQTGVLAPPCDEAALAEAIVGLLRDPARRRRLGENGRRRVEREFNLRTNVQRVVVWLEGLCRGVDLLS